MSDFQAAKTWLASSLGMSKDALHICVGLAIFLLAAALFRSRLRDMRPLVAVLVVALAGEAWDFYDSWRAGEALRWDRAWHDLWITSVWPVVLYVLARWTRILKP